MKASEVPSASASGFTYSDPLNPNRLLTGCDVCGSPDLAEIKCKVICRNCRTILQSCANL